MNIVVHTLNPVALMALRASATARSPELSQPPKTLLLPSKAGASSKHRLNYLPLPPQSAVAAAFPLLTLVASPNEAKALSIPKEQIVSSLTQVESTIDRIQEFGSKFFSTAGQVIGGVADAVKPALPVLKQAAEQAVKIASPVVSEASKKAQEALQSSGIDTEPVITAAKTVAGAVDEAKPIATSTVQTIASAEPTVILGTGGALVIAYFLIPPIFSVISYSLRGYQGDLTATQALDLMSTKNYLMIDIRPEKEKNKAGVPRLPNNARNQLVSIPLEELPSNLKGIVGSIKKVEAELVAKKISYLKKVNKGSNIIILDSYSDPAKIVARTLTKLGFKNTFVVADGFSGGKGWLQSRLGADSYNVSIAEVITPSRVISGTTGGTASRTSGSTAGKTAGSTAGRRLTTPSPTMAKLLPGGSE